MTNHQPANKNTQEPVAPADTFFGLGIAPGILDILKRIHFVTPTPIQRKAIPLALDGKDVVGIAQT